MILKMQLIFSILHFNPKKCNVNYLIKVHIVQLLFFLQYVNFKKPSFIPILPCEIQHNIFTSGVACYSE